jgi:RecA-family ATPase
MNYDRVINDQSIPQPERLNYVVRDARYALEQPAKSLDFVVDQVIPVGSLSMFFGEPGSKKTYAVISLAVNVAAGKDNWLGFRVKQCPVLIIDEESGERRLNLRIAAALRGELAGPETPLNYVSLAGFKLDKPNHQTILQALIEDTKAGLVIIDALADIMDGDENTKQDTQPIMTALRKIAEATGAAILIVHHSGKNGGYRGSSALKGAVDFMLLVESENGSKWINFKSEKNRDGEAVKWSAVATWTPTQFYLSHAEITEKKKALTVAETFVVDYLTKHGASPMPDIKASADICSARQAQNAVYSLAKRGEIYRINPEERGQGAVAVYDLPKKEEPNKAENND